MPRIVGVDTVVHNLLLNSPFKISHKVLKQKQDRLFVRIWSEDGRYGIGEAAPLPFFTGETTPVIREIIDHLLGPAMIGQEALDVRAVMADLEERIPGNSSIKAAVEMALWDLAGKCRQLPSAPVGVRLSRLSQWLCLGLGRPGRWQRKQRRQ